MIKINLFVEGYPKVNLFAYSQDFDGKINYLNIVAEKSTLKEFLRVVNKQNFKLNINRCVYYAKGKYEYILSREGNNAIIYKSDIYGGKEVNLNIFTENNEELRFSENPTAQHILFEKIRDLTEVPILEEWMNALIGEKVFFTYRSRILSENNKDEKNNNSYLNIYNIVFNINNLIENITSLIEKGIISVGNSKKTSRKMELAEGLDDYLNLNSKYLAQKISENFESYFNPDIDTYSDKLIMFDERLKNQDFYLHEKQKAIIQGLSNYFNDNSTGLLIGQPGCGKTAMSMYTVLLNAKKPNTFNIVMCPGHLVNKWKRTLEADPFVDSIIIESLEEFLELEKKLKRIKLNRHLFIVMAKDSVKTKYVESPAGVWNNVKKCYVCPDCGQPLYIEKRDKRTHMPYLEYFNETSFLKKGYQNSYCMNSINKWNDKKGIYEKVYCRSKLWTVSTKDNDNFIKLGKYGFIKKEHINTILDNLSNKIKTQKLEKKESELLQALIQYKDGKNFIKMAPRNFSLAKYIRNNYNNKIDYLIIDEIHQYSGDSIQGDAAADLISASNKVLGLTGTLLNGMASGIFYLLFRMNPSMMKKDGYNYYNKTDFAKDYGVISTITETTSYPDQQKLDKVKKKTKELPGISPLIFTRYLLESSVFISLDDMSDRLPNYREVPIGIEMDEELNSAYSKFEEDIRNSLKSNKKNFGKVRYALVNSLYNYPDSPDYIEPIVNWETGDTIATPTMLEPKIRNKEQAFIDLIKERIANNEKVLVYYSFTESSNIESFLPEILESEGIKTAVLKTDSTKKISEREKWIEDQVKNGVQVLFTNPKLVETGLDLLDFTSIIYYQISYELFTLRQSSRRSMRLNQTKDVTVYFLYYSNTVQEIALSVMATKLQAAMTIEGKISEEGLQALSDNQDVLSKIAGSVIEGIKDTVTTTNFSKSINVKKEIKKKIKRNNIVNLNTERHSKLNAVDIRDYVYRECEKLDKELLEIF